MGNKRNKLKRSHLKHIKTARANAKRTNSMRWSNHDKENDEGSNETGQRSLVSLSNDICESQPSNEVESSSIMDRLDENRLPLVELCTVSPTPLESSSIMDHMDENEIVSPIPSKEETLIIEEEYIMDNMDENQIVTPTPSKKDETIIEEEYIMDNMDEHEIVARTPTPSKEDETLIIEEEGHEDLNSGTHMGRRLIDVAYFFRRLQEISAHNSLFQCNLSNITIVSEKRIGFISHLKLKCELCSQYFSVSSDDPNHTNNVDVNTAACSGIIASGIGYSQFEEICGAMDVPIFTEKYFAKVQNQVFDDWEATAVEVMEAAAARERDAAIAEGRIKDGKPVIDVYVDGAWCSRSYGNNYKALSGVAAIVGRRFGEVLFIGVKNKYCLICARAEKKNETPKEHVCYKNYEGSSSGMEAAIICEGFLKSVEMYGLIYGNVIGDGDSSTYSKIVAANPYPNHVVCKIECRNHLMRNMCNKLRAMTKDTKYPLVNRKLITDKRIMSIRKVITTSITENRQKHNNRDEAIKHLHEDVCNSINHAFGDHRSCKDYYCNKERSFDENVIPQIENSIFWFRVRVIINSVASKSRSLIENVDTNTVERLNSVIAKFVGGKRINWSLRRSYQSRCSAAVVAFNTKRPIYTLHKKILGRSPRGSLKRCQEKRDKKRHLTNLVTRKKNRKRKLITKQNDYGESPAAPDMSEEDLKEAKTSFLDRLKDLVKDRKNIEKKTVLQRDSSEWLELRKLILTASNFGKVIKRKKNYGNCVKQILYTKNISFVRSIAHGVGNEGIALQQLAKQENILIQPCGIFIDPEIDFLGASPDGVVGDDTVIEIKCPVAAHKKGMAAAIIENKVQILRHNKKTGITTVNKNSDWYYQAQGQLHISRRERCIFGIWGGEDQKMEVLYIKRDKDFWKDHMEKKLVNFYMTQIIPEIVDSRHARGMSLRYTDEPVNKDSPHA